MNADHFVFASCGKFIYFQNSKIYYFVFVEKDIMRIISNLKVTILEARARRWDMSETKKVAAHWQLKAYREKERNKKKLYLQNL